MINIVSTLVFALSLGFSVQSQDFFSSIHKGKALEVNIKPIGDAYSDPDDEHTIRLSLLDDEYILELLATDVVQSKVLNESEAIDVISFFEGSKKSRCRGGECGLTYSQVQMTIGRKNRKFREGFYYASEILDKYLSSNKD